MGVFSYNRQVFFLIFGGFMKIRIVNSLSLNVFVGFSFGLFLSIMVFLITWGLVVHPFVSVFLDISL